MEAPEIIYVADTTFPDYVNFDGSPINTKRIDRHDIEYIRTDAFIEKACGWLKNNVEKYYYLDEAYDRVINTKNLNNDFKKYMED